ncbi:aryl-alcohol dehydrogenase-like predicted oxidoreductase [Kaistia dalseonensis]|uniref:Aryl-alcohol dehydrogenase-like predicted oxidoreductase n=2 Tax=Kaistia dalseonensis TaxID=410840 RepID=A0ABU0HCY8_9HYPH|nr:aryl-alcohol dehydrogenase-like predicted oxidoreductase [Kaistia dalseonensis]
MMEYRQLGRSGLRVSTLSLGTMTFGGKGPFANVGNTDAAGARRQMAMAIDAGINLIDTANVYSDGASEEIIGEALPVPRDQVLLATKCRMRIGNGPNDGGASRLHIIAELEKSLRRLRTDYVDLYQLHQWDGQTPLEETMEALDSLVRSGKVRYVGASNYSGWHLMKALAAADQHNYQRYVSQQIHYTLQAREAEYELLPITVDQGLGTLIWSPLAGGLLSGKYRRGKDGPEGSRRLTAWQEPPVRDEGKLYDIVDVVVEIAEAHGVSGAQIALAWLLGRPGVTSLIIGARTDAQLADNLKSVDVKLTEDERARLDKVSELPLLYPYWHQAATASERLSKADLVFLAPYL